MPFHAELHGREISSLRCDEATWLEAVAESRRGGKELLLRRCCGARVVAKVSKRETRFFAHKDQTDCPRVHESADHIELKMAALAAAEAAGWTAMEEACQRDIEGIDGPVPERGGFEIDVLVRKGRALMALEVQLSRQGADETEAREKAYLDAGIMPYWFVSPVNDKRHFGSERRALIEGESLDERCRSIGNLVIEFLRSVESQVAMARALKEVLALDGWQVVIEGCGRIPVVVEATRGRDRQSIVLAELGRAALPGHPAHIAKRHTQFAGGVVQLHCRRRAIANFGTAAFRVAERAIEAEVAKHVRPVMNGHRVWRGENHAVMLDGTFVGYHERCEQCHVMFYRTPYIIAGVSGGPEGMEFVIRPLNAAGPLAVLSDAAEAHDARMGVHTGALYGYQDPLPGRANSQLVDQRCPSCGVRAPTPLISEQEAKLWPYAEGDFLFNYGMPGRGWGQPLVHRKRRPPSKAVWDKMIQARRDDRDAAIERGRREAQERRDREEKERAEQKRQREQAAESARIEEERQRELANKERLAAEKEAREKEESERRAQRLAVLEEAAFKFFESDEVRARMWLRGKHPQLRFQAPRDYAALGDDELRECLALLQVGGRAGAKRMNQ